MDPSKAIRLAMMVAKSLEPVTAKPLFKSGGGSADPKFLPVGHPERQKNLDAFMKGAHPSVLNEDGTPKRILHGTKDDIKEFVHGQKNKKDKGWLGEGFYFTDSPLIASLYADQKQGDHGPMTMPVHLNLKNPFEATQEHKTALRKALMSDPDAAKKFRNKLIEMGHDGVFIKHDIPSANIEYVAFHPHQIKSAIGNRGTYDPNEPEIDKAGGGEVIPHGHPERQKNLDAFMEGAHPSVLNADGTPKVFYHGTKRKFSAFKPAYEDNLIFFTTNPQFASKWPVGNGGLRDPSPEGKEEFNRLRKVQQQIADSMPQPETDSDEDSFRYLESIRQKFKEHSGFRSPYDYESHAETQVMPVHIAAKNPFNPQTDWKKIEPFLLSHPQLKGLVAGGHHKKGNWLVYENKDVINHLKKMGHDSIWLSEDTDGPQETLAAFSPNQVKSAIGNRGTYDPNEPEIDKAGGGEVVPHGHPEREENLAKFMEGSHLHDDGVPRRYYTGTSKDKDFKSFNVGRHGAWFTTDPKEASMYARENDSQNVKYERGKYVHTNTASRVIPAYLRALNPHTGEAPEHIRTAQNYKKAQSDWFDQLRAQGYDSWVPASANGSLAVILGHPGQIKSAVGNLGTYDLDEKDIHKAGGGDVEGDEPSGIPQGRAQQRMAGNLAVGPQPTSIVKEKGGQWMTGSVDPMLGSLKQNKIAPLAGYTNVTPEHGISEANTAIEATNALHGLPEEKKQEMLAPFVDYLKNAHRHKAVNDWVGSTLKKYIMRDMGTEGDPVRALAERRILHVSPDQLNYRPEWHGTALQEGQRHVAKSDAAKAWEGVSDNALSFYPAKHAIAGGLHSSNPWLERMNPEENVHSIHDSQGASKDLGFDHLVDELHNSLRHDSDLPQNLRLRPEALQRMSVPQAVEHVYNVNNWRAGNITKANLKKAFNPATFLHKAYPGSDYAWYEIKKPENADNVHQTSDEETSAADHVRQALKYEGKTMAHCVGGYADDVLSGDTRIFSLRNKKTGEPHVTIETTPAKPRDFVRSELADKLQRWPTKDELDKEVENNKYDIKQIKGKGNAKPLSEHIPYVQDFVKSGNWDYVDDFHNTDLIDWENLDAKHYFHYVNNADRYQPVTAQMILRGQIPPRYLTEDEFHNPESLLKPAPWEQQDAPKKARGGTIAEVPVKVDPQKAIRKALMVAKLAGVM